MSNSENDNGGKKEYRLSQFKRNRYFYGKMLSVRDFEDEQNYMNGKRHLFNRVINGPGIVCGFLDAAPGAGDNKLMVNFNGGGLALDCTGHEIVVPPGSEREIYPTDKDIPLAVDSLAAGTTLYLYLEANPREYELVSSAANPAGVEEECQFNRVLEDFKVVATASKPPDPHIEGPDLSGFSPEESGAAAREVGDWLREETGKMCTGCKGNGVFFLAIEMTGDPENPVEVLEPVTEKYRAYIHNNQVYSALWTDHLPDFNNPHQSFNGLTVNNTAEEGTLLQTKVVHDKEFITIENGEAIQLLPDPDNHKITITETHSIITENNPHDVQHTELLNVPAIDPDNEDDTEPDKHVTNADARHWNNALQSVNGVTRDADGDVQLKPADESNLVIISGDKDDPHSVIFDDPHSRDLGNPHQSFHGLTVKNKAEGGTQEQTKVVHDKEFLTIENGEAIQLLPDPDNHKIRITETHSGDLGNPHQSFNGLTVNNRVKDGPLEQTKVVHQDELITIENDEAIQLIADPETHTITITETHSRTEEKNPHNVKHEQLEDAVGIFTGDNDTTYDKHVSNADAKRWNQSLIGLDGVGVGDQAALLDPGTPGNVDLEVEGDIIEIQPDKDNKRIIFKDKHADIMGNPHKITHDALPDMAAVSTTGTGDEEEDKKQNKHISNKLALEWQNAIGNFGTVKALFGIAPNNSGNIGLEAAGSISIQKGKSPNSIQIGENHTTSGDKNPHATRHSDLESVPAINTGNVTDTKPDKHVSNADAKRWNEAADAIAGASTMLFPTGCVLAFAMRSAPGGWLECNGQAVDRKDYKALYDAIGETFGAGNGNTTFNVPDLRGEFIRGWDGGTEGSKGSDPNRSFGSRQNDQIQSHRHNDAGHSHSFSHSHGIEIKEWGGHNHKAYAEAWDGNPLCGSQGWPQWDTHNLFRSTNRTSKRTIASSAMDSVGHHSHPATIHNATLTIHGNANLTDPINAPHGPETRPENVALLYCIKF